MQIRLPFFLGIGIRVGAGAACVAEIGPWGVQSVASAAHDLNLLAAISAEHGTFNIFILTILALHGVIPLEVDNFYKLRLLMTL